MSALLNSFLTFSIDHQSLVLSLLGALVLAVILAMLVVILRPGRRAATTRPAEDLPRLPGALPADPAPPDPAPDGGRPAAKAFRRLLREGLAAYRAAYSRNPYLMPWLLAIGAPQDGGLLSAVDSIRPAVGLAEGDSLSWRYFERGVVISLADPARLKALLGFLNFRRPALPLDGAILLLPLAKLADPQTAAAFGAEVYNQLWEIQRRSGFTLPVHVVVTGTEALTGFRGFEAVLPPDLRRGILGWSFPFPLETAFSPDHVRMALATIEQGLLAVILECFGTLMPSPQATALVRCKQELAALGEPLTAFLGVALRRTAFQECHYFRGLFFITRPSAAAPASFAADLMDRKIFAESGLSKPLRGLQRWRSWRRNLWPAAVPAAVLAMVASLWLSLAEIEDYRSQVAPLLKITAADIESLSTRPAAELTANPAAEAAARYLRAVAVVGRSRPALALPQAWLDGDGWRVAAAMRAGWHKILLKAVRLTIEQRLAGLGQTTGGDSADAALADFLTRLKEAETNAQTFNQVIHGGADAPVGELLRYAFRLPLSDEAARQLKAWRLVGAEAPPVDDPSLAVDLDHYRATTQQAFRGLADRYFRRLAEGGQLAVRLTLVAGELEALAGGRRTPAAAETGFAEVSAGLEEAAQLLTSGRPSWIGASQAAFPADMQALFEVAGQSRLLGPAARDEALRMARQRFAEVKDQLGQVGSVIGPLAARNADGTAALTAQADGLRQLLAQWFARPFMRQAGEAADRRQALDPLTVEAIPPLFDDYLLFATRTLPAAPPQLRPAMQRAAQFRLQTAVESVLAPSQLLIDPRFIERAGQNDLREAARILHTAFPVLEQAIQSYLQIGMAAPAERLRNQVDRAAAAIIGRLDEIIETNQLYRPNDNSLLAWESGPLSAPDLFNQRGAGSLGELLIASRLEIASLARDIASPMVEILERPLLLSAQSHVAARWRGILTALELYDGSRPNSSLMMLERFIRDDLGKIDTTNCAGLRGGDEIAGDWFAERLASLRDDIRSRCLAVTDARLYAGYRQLARLFNEQLAGRVPFAAADPGTPADGADPEMIREFYRLLELHAKDVADPLKSLAATAAEWREPARFLETMTAARPLLLHLANGGSLAVLPHFRVNRDREAGGRDILEWRLQIGEQSVSSLAPGTTAIWAIGDPVEVALRWAKDAPVRPLRPLGPQAAGLQGLTVSYRQQNPWSLLLFIRRQRGLAAERPQQARPIGPILEFAAETTDAPPVLLPSPDAAGQAPPPPEVRATSRVYLSLELRKLVEGEGKPREEPISLPNLPESAPGLDKEPELAGR